MAFRLADGAGKALRAAHARDDAELDFRLAEFRGVRGKYEIAHHGKFAAAAKRHAGHGGDQRGAGARDGVPAGEPVRAVHVDEGLRGHLLDVGTRGKGAFGTCQHDAADIRIAVETGQCGGQFGQDLQVQRVQRLGAVQGYARDTSGGLGEYGFICVGHDQAGSASCLDCARMAPMMAEKSSPGVSPDSNVS